MQLFYPIKTASGRTHTNQFNKVLVGAGGLCCGIKIASDGTKVCRIDQYGAYIAAAGTSSLWNELITSNSMPAASVTPENANPGGPYDIAIAPSLTSRLYMTWVDGQVYRSNNSGATWTLTGFTQISGGISVNGGTRTNHPYLAVDPNNPDVVYAGTPSNGLFVTTNGGTSWTLVSVVQSGTAGSGNLICFDTTNGTTAGKTNNIVVSTNGTGVYRSTNAGASWTLTNSAGMPTTHSSLFVDQFGVIWQVDATGAQGWGNLNRFIPTTPSGSTGTWSVRIANTAQSPHATTVDPRSGTQGSSTVVCASIIGDLYISTDGGATFPTTANTPTFVSPDVGWLHLANMGTFSLSAVAFDPNGVLYVTAGVGIWRTTTPSSSSVTYTSQSAGTESLTGNGVTIPPGGNPIVFGWDIPLFNISNPNAYPSDHGPDTSPHAFETTQCFSVDWVAGTPKTLVAVINQDAFGPATNEQSGISTDGGATWTPFATLPASLNAGGCIAALSTTNFIWAQSNNGRAYYTLNGGSNWTPVSITGVPTAGEVGWGFSYANTRQIVTPDRVTPSKAYIYNLNSGTPAATGLYTTLDGGATWSQTFSGQIAGQSGFDCTIKSVPNNAGHLFFCSGLQAAPHPQNLNFMRSKDGGVTWSSIPNWLEVVAFGFGASYNGSYPAICAAGWYNNNYGIYESRDGGTTWNQMGVYPVGVFATPKAIDGDKVTPGKWYVATSCGNFYGSLV